MNIRQRFHLGGAPRTPRNVSKLGTAGVAFGICLAVSVVVSVSGSGLLVGCGGDEKGKKDELCQGAAAKKCVSRGVSLQTKGDEQNVKTALGLYKMTCKGKGEWAMKGCTLAGHLYRTGKPGVPKDEAKALELYEKACRLDDKDAHQVAAACFRAGNAYGLERLGAKSDPEKAKRYLDVACKKGEKLGCKFAKMLGRSTGKSSLAQVTARCEKGKAKDCTELGYRYYKGNRGVKKDGAKALKYLKKACDLKDGGACSMVGLFYEKGKVGVSKDKAKSRTYYRKGCDLGYQNGCISLAKGMLMESKDKKKRAEAVKLLTTGCDKKKKRACMWLGVAYTRGFGVKKNRKKAKTLFKKACALGDRQGCRFAKK